MFEVIGWVKYEEIGWVGWKYGWCRKALDIFVVLKKVALFPCTPKLNNTFLDS